MTNYKTQKKTQKQVNTNKYRTKKRNIYIKNKLNTNIYLNDQYGGFILDFFKSGKEKKIEKMIKYSNIDTLILKSLIKNESNKALINTEYFNKIIVEFLINVLNSFYTQLKKNKSVFKPEVYNQYNHNKIFKFKSKTPINTKITSILKSFVSILFATSHISIYPLNFNYNLYNNNYNVLYNYFKNTDITHQTVNSYLNSIIQYDNTNTERHKTKLFEINEKTQKPGIDYKKIMIINSNNTNRYTNVGNINISDTNKDKNYLIIFKNFSDNNKNNNTFKYLESFSTDNLYILENSFIKICNGIDNYYRNLSNDFKSDKSKTKKQSKYILTDIKTLFLNKEHAKRYGHFLYYYYCSQVFI
jgi:hypothetical protein